MLPIVGLVFVCAVVLWWSKELWLPTMIPAWRPKAERRQRGWATPQDLHRAGMVGAGYQVGVMRPGKTPVRVPDEMSTLVVAPPGAWKTTRVAVPVLEGWAGPAVVTSTKRDLYDLTVQARGRRGPVYVFDPRGVTGQPSVGWNPTS